MTRGRRKIILARTAGFCMGVRRAVKLAMEAANDPANPVPIRTVGPLIHNRQVVELLERKGVGVLDDEGQDPGTALIRAHGLPPARKEELQDTCDKVIDATCPHVLKVQRIAQKYSEQGYNCVIVGDRGHAEVRSVLSFASPRGHVISGPDEVDELPDFDKVVVVAQTTQNVGMFEHCVEKLRERWPDCRVFDTVCRATQFRQQEVERLAKKVDAMVIVGGYHSGNTRRLKEISEATGTPTSHVETDDELDEDWLAEHRTVGVTAGASTPNWMIRRVLRRIRRVHHRQDHSPTELLRNILAGPIHANFFVGGAAAALTFVNAALMGVSGSSLAACCALAFLFILAQHLLNQYTKREAIYLNDPGKAEFFGRHKRSLLVLGIAATVGALVLAAFLGWIVFGLIALGSAGGILYRLDLGRELGRRIGLKSIQQIPGSKELFVGLAWAVTTAFIPALAMTSGAVDWRALAVAFPATFILAGQRTLIGDLGDVEGDQLVGRETVAVVLGPSKSKWLFLVSLLFEVMILALVGGYLGWATTFSYFLLLLVPYAGGLFLLHHYQRMPEGELGEALIDSTFYISAILAALWVWSSWSVPF